MKHLSKYSDLATRGLPLEFLQNGGRGPRFRPRPPVGRTTKRRSAPRRPVPRSRRLGDLELRAQGYRYMFVSNWTTSARRRPQAAHLVRPLGRAVRDGGEHLTVSLVSPSHRCASAPRPTRRRPPGEIGGDRRTAAPRVHQCAAEDEAAFQDVTQHKFFNTNNLCAKAAFPALTPGSYARRSPAPSRRARFAQVGRPRRSARGSAAAGRGRPASARHEEWQDRRPARQGEPEGAAARDRDGRCDPSLPGARRCAAAGVGDARRTTPAWFDLPPVPCRRSASPCASRR